jgi:hypothetical protein
MNKEQMEVLTAMHEVMRGVVCTIAALNPDRTADVQTMLATFAEQPGLEPIARKMLLDLSEGPGILVSGTHRKQ